MLNTIGKIPYGYIYISFFPSTSGYPEGSFYIGQHKKDKFNPNYHGSGNIVSNWKKAHKNLKSEIKTILLCWAYSLKELNDLEYYWISDYYNHSKHKDSMNIKAGGYQSGYIVSNKIKNS
jgi:hypothetical protein